MFLLYSLYSGYKNTDDSNFDAETYKCVNWTEVELGATETSIALKGHSSGPESLNVSDMIKKHNSKIFPVESYFGTTYSPLNICNNADISASLCVPKFDPWLSKNFAMAPKSKTIACRIHQSVSTVLENLICYLDNENAFRACKYKTFSTNERLCEDRIDVANIENIVESQNISSFEHLFQDWNVFAVIRHPIDRLLSGFLDKCISHPTYLDAIAEDDKFNCYGCGANFTCFVINQYHRLMAQSQHPLYRITNSDLHFFPQNWRCEFNKFLPNISIVKYSYPETGEYDADWFVDGLMNVLRQKDNVNPESLKFVEKQLKQSNTIHVTQDTNARQFLQKLLSSNPFLMEFVVRMYYWDFVLFGYPLPEINI